jgi:hypothetical protein
LGRVFSYIHIIFEGDSNQAKLTQQIADAFEAETGIHVEIQINGWADYWTVF